jgi:hypothetical protein
MRPCGSRWSKISAWQKKQELCVVGLEAAGAGYMRLSHKDMHGPLNVTCAISPAQERRMGLWGSLRHKTQASFSVSLPSRTWSRWHNSTQIHDKGLGGGAGLGCGEWETHCDCGRLLPPQPATDTLIAPLAIAPSNHAMSLAAFHPTPPTPTSIIRSLHLPSPSCCPVRLPTTPESALANHQSPVNRPPSLEHNRATPACRRKPSTAPNFVPVPHCWPPQTIYM